MAKQDGESKLTGTIGNITFYEAEGVFLARKKSSLTRKRFFKDEAFERSRKSCRRLGLGSQLASIVYQSLPKAKKHPTLYSSLRSLAIAGLKEGKSDENVLKILEQYLAKRRKSKTVRVKVVKRTLRPRIFIVFPHTNGKVKRVQRRTIHRLLREGKASFSMAMAGWLKEKGFC